MDAVLDVERKPSLRHTLNVHVEYEYSVTNVGKDLI